MAGSRNRSAARHLSCNGKKSDTDSGTLDSAPNSIWEEKTDSGMSNRAINWKTNCIYTDRNGEIHGNA